MLILQNITYQHSNKDLLFSNINLAINSKEKIALIGNNGSGKSTLLKLINGDLKPISGQIKAEVKPCYIPQIFGQFDDFTIAEALKVNVKLKALQAILEGNTNEENFNDLADDWTIEERCKEALSQWQLADLTLSQKLSTLSGGQKTKVFLAGIEVHKPRFILMDEPSNHLDVASRKLLYEFVQSDTATLLLVSHDKKLLNLLDKVCELNSAGITVYGGNYDFYEEQKEIELNALNHDLKSRERALKNAKEKEREATERQQKLDAKGKKKQEKAGVSRIMMNTLRNKAENSTAKLKGVHTDKINGIAQELQQLRSNIPDIDKMKFGFEDTDLHIGKTLFEAVNINFAYSNQHLWKNDLDFLIKSGERILLKGSNGSGKTTLIRIILGKLQVSKGTLKRQDLKSVYIDQDYSLINNDLNVYDQAQQFNDGALQEHEIKIRLNRFLFTKETWDKPCRNLSGGEKMRLSLCCLTISQKSPDLIVLDEPTNNLDIQNIDIMVTAINNYHGTLIVVSHDEHFLSEINIGREVVCEAKVN
ncbi:MAG TPA: ABC-F family ATP-binding cassette domain-containing protein [Pelobium sp.]|nr:ABC-F family ATP-binding cassette domain-containing protein [Pelobium sp.]